MAYEATVWAMDESDQDIDTAGSEADERSATSKATAPKKKTQKDARRKCEVCGNHYYRTFEVILDGETHVFDSFECAIHALAPTCAHCDCRIVGHGVEVGGSYYCCDHCLRNAGKDDHAHEQHARH